METKSILNEILYMKYELDKPSYRPCAVLIVESIKDLYEDYLKALGRI